MFLKRLQVALPKNYLSALIIGIGASTENLKTKPGTDPNPFSVYYRGLYIVACTILGGSLLYLLYNGPQNHIPSIKAPLVGLTPANLASIRLDNFSTYARFTPQRSTLSVWEGYGSVAEWIHFTLFGIILPTITLRL